MVVVVVTVMVGGRLNAERAVHPASDTARDATDRCAYHRAYRTRSPIARRASYRRSLLRTPHDPLSLSNRGHSQ
jgi:hypothetical protein